MDAVFLALLNRSIAAGWLVLAVVAVRALLKNAPKNLRCLLWGLVALRLLLPARLKSIFSLVPSARTVPPEILLSETPTVQTGFAAVDQAVNPVFTESFAPTAGASVNPLQIWVLVGAIVWLCGLAAMLLYAVISYLQLRRRVAESVPLRENIRLSDRIVSPFVLGMIRPKIYLPFGLSEETMALVLAHEQGHIARHDHWLKPFGFLLLSLCWFHPLAWLAYVLYCRDIELACDEHVLRSWGPAVKKAYSSALLACSVKEQPLAACPLAFGESNVKERIQSVLSYKKPMRWLVCLGVFALAILCVCFLTDPVERSADAATLEDGEWSDFLAELIRVESEEGGYLGEPTKIENGQSFVGPYSYTGYARRYDAPLLRLPGADEALTDSGLVLVWDDGERLRLKEIWYDEEEQEALVVRWSPGVSDPDPAYGEGGLSYPEYSWSHSTLDWDFDFEGTRINLHFYNYSSERFPSGYIRLTEGMHFAPAESLLTPTQQWIVRATRMMTLELGGYEAISEDDFAVRWDAPLLRLPTLPDRFRQGESLYVLGPELENPRFARIWTSDESGELLFASWRENPGGAESPLQMGYTRPDALQGWVNFQAESRGKLKGTDLVLRYYAADPDTDPEAVRAFLEDAEFSSVPAPTPNSVAEAAVVTLPDLSVQPAVYDAEITVPVGGSAYLLPALGMEGRMPSGVGMDIYDAGYVQLKTDEGGPLVLGRAPTETPVPIEVNFSKQSYRVGVTVVPDPAGNAAPLYNEPDPASVEELSILFNDRPVSDLTVPAGMHYVLDTQAVPGGAVKAEWTSSDESVARVTVRVDGRCVLETLRRSETPITLTAVYGEHRAELALTVG